MKDKVSRRDFLKLALTSIGAFLASCMPRVTQTLTPTITSTSTKTSTPEPTSTNTSTPTPTETQIPTLTAIPCFHLLTPENGAKLPTIGKVAFSWEAMQGAVSYQLQFIFPSGQVVSFDVENTSNTRYIESLIAGGIYTWQVIALDSRSAIVCITEPFTFEKPAYTPPQNNGGEGGGDTSGGGPSTSGTGGPGTGGTSGSDGEG